MVLLKKIFLARRSGGGWCPTSGFASVGKPARLLHLAARMKTAGAMLYLADKANVLGRYKQNQLAIRHDVLGHPMTGLSRPWTAAQHGREAFTTPNGWKFAADPEAADATASRRANREQSRADCDATPTAPQGPVARPSHNTAILPTAAPSHPLTVPTPGRLPDTSMPMALAAANDFDAFLASCDDTTTTLYVFGLGECLQSQVKQGTINYDPSPRASRPAAALDASPSSTSTLQSVLLIGSAPVSPRARQESTCRSFSASSVEAGNVAASLAGTTNSENNSMIERAQVPIACTASRPAGSLHPANRRYVNDLDTL